MRITHVIRGDDHLSNTPKQILCYEALDYAVPEFAHAPLILGKDRSRLSKRHGATSVQAFRDAGFPADALVNYLARLGWSHGDQEVFSRAELVELFDIKNVATSAAVFDVTKLEWLSQHYLKTMSGGKLAELAEPFIRAAGLTPPDDRARFVGMLDTLRERSKTLVELVEQGRFYFERPAAYEPKGAQKLLTVEGARRLGLLIERLEAEPEFTVPAIERVVRGLTEELGLKLVDLAQLARLAVTGRTASPPIFDVLALGEWEGCTVDEVRAREGNPYLSWVRAPLDCPPPGGEPLPDVCARVLQAIGRIATNHRDGEDVLVVAHGGVISVYLCHLLGVSFNSLWRMRIDNCSLTIARPPRLVSVNDTAHLPPMAQTRWFDVSPAGGSPAGVPPSTRV